MNERNFMLKQIFKSTLMYKDFGLTQMFVQILDATLALRQP